MYCSTRQSTFREVVRKTLTDLVFRMDSTVNIRPLSRGFSIPDIRRGKLERARGAAGAFYRVVALVLGFCGRVVLETDDGERAVRFARCHRKAAYEVWSIRQT